MITKGQRTPKRQCGLKREMPWFTNWLRVSWSIGVWLVFATAAQAACPLGQEAFTSCQIVGRNTEVFACFNDEIATYRYGPIGEAPDLVLSKPLETVDFEAWSGLGKAIHENITFYNGDFSYEVGGGFERPFSEEEMQQGIRRFGWVEVAQNGNTLNRLECIPDTVTYGFGGGIYDAKVAAGLLWDDRSKTWMPAGQTKGSALAGILTKQTRNGVEADCLPMAEFEVRSVRLGYPIAQLNKLIPPVVGQVLHQDAIDIERFNYDGLRLDTFGGDIFEIVASAPFWQMPSGLRVGLTRGEVIRILGRVPGDDMPTADRFFAVACADNQSAPGNWHLTITFGPDKRVRNIVLTTISL